MIRRRRYDSFTQIRRILQKTITKPIVRCFFMTGLTVIPSLTLPLAARVKDPGTFTITAPTTCAESQGG